MLKLVAKLVKLSPLFKFFNRLRYAVGREAEPTNIRLRIRNLVRFFKHYPYKNSYLNRIHQFHLEKCYSVQIEQYRVFRVLCAKTFINPVTLHRIDSWLKIVGKFFGYNVGHRVISTRAFVLLERHFQLRRKEYDYPFTFTKKITYRLKALAKELTRHKLCDRIKLDVERCAPYPTVKKFRFQKFVHKYVKYQVRSFYAIKKFSYNVKIYLANFEYNRFVNNEHDPFKLSGHAEDYSRVHNFRYSKLVGLIQTLRARVTYNTKNVKLVDIINQWFNRKKDFLITELSYTWYSTLIKNFLQRQLAFYLSKYINQEVTTAVSSFINSYYWSFFPVLNPGVDFIEPDDVLHFDVITGFGYNFSPTHVFDVPNTNNLIELNDYRRTKKPKTWLEWILDPNRPWKSETAIGRHVAAQLCYILLNARVKRPRLRLHTLYIARAAVFSKSYYRSNVESILPTEELAYQKFDEINQRIHRLHKWLEAAWGLAPIVIIVFIYIPSATLLNELDREDNPVISIKIVGMQWEWVYEYSHVAGPRGVYNSRLMREREYYQRLTRSVLEGLVVARSIDTVVKETWDRPLFLKCEDNLDSFIENRVDMPFANRNPYKTIGYVHSLDGHRVLTANNMHWNRIVVWARAPKNRLKAPSLNSDLCAPGHNWWEKKANIYSVTQVRNDSYDFLNFRALKPHYRAAVDPEIIKNTPENFYKTRQQYFNTLVENIAELRYKVKMKKFLKTCKNNILAIETLSDKLAPLALSGVRNSRLNPNFIGKDEARYGALIPKSLINKWIFAGSALQEYYRIQFERSTGISLIRRLPSFIRYYSTNKPMLMPWNVETRLLVTSRDVIHSWAVPAFGFKVDAIPGRINRVCVTPWRLGMFYGQCSELCGVGHALMPISVLVVSTNEYLNWLHMLKVGPKSYLFQRSLVRPSRYTFID